MRWPSAHIAQNSHQWRKSQSHSMWQRAQKKSFSWRTAMNAKASEKALVFVYVGDIGDDVRISHPAPRRELSICINLYLQLINIKRFIISYTRSDRQMESIHQKRKESTLLLHIHCECSSDLQTQTLLRFHFEFSLVFRISISGCGPRTGALWRVFNWIFEN